MRWISALFLLAATWAAPHAGELYRWIDADGVVHFSDHPPADGDAERRDVPRLERVGTVAPPAPARSERPVDRRPALRPSGNEVSGLRMKRAEQCHRARQRARAVRATLRTGYRASQYRGLRQREARARADIRFYCE